MGNELVQTMGKIAVAGVEVGKAILQKDFADQEMPKRFRCAATLSFGVYDDNFTVRQRPKIDSATLNKVRDWNDDYPWTKGFNFNRQYECPIASNKFTIHYVETAVHTLIVWVTFRGTANNSNIAVDLAAFYAPLPNEMCSDDGILVHGGFLISYMLMRATILSALRSLPRPIFSITVTGHSLGGALATLCSFDLMINSKKEISYEGTIQLITFGCPHVGSEPFASKFRSLVARREGNMKPYLLVNEKDAVPQLCHASTLAKKGINLAIDKYVRSERSICTDDFVHIADLETLDQNFVGYIEGDGAARVISQHQGPAYINNLERFLNSSAMSKLVNDALAAPNNFGVELMITVTDKTL